MVLALIPVPMPVLALLTMLTMLVQVQSRRAPRWVPATEQVERR
jgi:hypothetical protein